VNLLPPDTLAKVRLGVSVSPSADLGRLGLLEEHFRLAIGELARMVLVLGGDLQYCGHLAPDGYTTFLMDELKRYDRQNDRLSVLLAWAVHRRLPLREIRRAEKDLGLFGSIQYLDIAGIPVKFAAGRGEEPPDLPEDEIAPSLSAMRQASIGQTQGRLFIGGRRFGYQGMMPGVLEEALLALSQGQPVFLAGGFGGVTHDLVERIDSRAAAWLPADGSGIGDHGWRTGLEKISEINGGRSWEQLANGLQVDENRQLAATHRSSEIAALVSLGMGRLAQAKAFLTNLEPPK